MPDAVKVGMFTVRPLLKKGEPTGTWQIDVPADLTEGGKRRRLSFPSRDAAVAQAKSFSADIRQRKLVAKAREVEGFHLSEVVGEWAQLQQTRVAAGKKRNASLVTNLYHLKALLKTVGDVPLASIGKHDLDRYQAARRRLGRKPETINSELATLTQVLNWAVERGWLNKVVKTDPIPLQPRQVLILEGEEAARLLRAIPDTYKPLVRLLAETGCRFGEAANLLWEHVDLERGIATIEARADWGPKSRFSARPLRLSPTLRSELASQRGAPYEYVFAGREGPHKPVDDIRRPMRRASREAGIMRRGQPVVVRPKDLRSFFATAQASGGTRERVLQDLLGHAPGTRVTKKHYEFGTEGESMAAAEAQWARVGS